MLISTLGFILTNTAVGGIVVARIVYIYDTILQYIENQFRKLQKTLSPLLNYTRLVL
jgi:hypothetical protein